MMASTLGKQPLPRPQHFLRIGKHLRKSLMGAVMMRGHHAARPHHRHPQVRRRMVDVHLAAERRCQIAPDFIGQVAQRSRRQPLTKSCDPHLRARPISRNGYTVPLIPSSKFGLHIRARWPGTSSARRSSAKRRPHSATKRPDGRRVSARKVLSDQLRQRFGSGS